VPFTEAQTLERFNRLEDAAVAYDNVGDTASAFRLRLEAARDSATRSRLRAGLLQFIEKDARGDDLVRALEVLDKEFPKLAPASQLTIARRAAAQGINDRAASAF